MTPLDHMLILRLAGISDHVLQAQLKTWYCGLRMLVEVEDVLNEHQATLDSMIQHMLSI